MRLDTRAFAIAAGLTAAVLFTICALAVAIAPAPTTAFFGYLVHADFSGLQRTLTFGSFVGGLIGWTLGAAVTFWLAGRIYNGLIAVKPATQALGHEQPTGQHV